MKRAVLCLSVSTIVLCAASPGIRPRADAKSYPVYQEKGEFAIGVSLIPPEQLKKMFKSDLSSHGYVVLEVGVFPAPGKEVDLYPTDFTLFIGEKSAALRTVPADTVAEVATGRKGRTGPRDSHDVETSAGVSIGRYSYPDPVTGRRRSETVTGTAAGVGVGGPPPRTCQGYDCDSRDPFPTTSQPPAPPSAQSANELSQDLWEKSLPDGKTTRAVAGYLFFPKPPRKAKDAAWELRYENVDGKTRLPLPR